MSWKVVDPTLAAKGGSQIARVDIPYFPDEIDYEEILGRAFSDPASRDFMASGGVVVLANSDGYDELKRLMDGAIDVPEKDVRETLVRLALVRNVVALRWTSD